MRFVGLLANDMSDDSDDENVKIEVAEVEIKDEKETDNTDS